MFKHKHKLPWFLGLAIALVAIYTKFRSYIMVFDSQTHKYGENSTYIDHEGIISHHYMIAKKVIDVDTKEPLYVLWNRNKKPIGETVVVDERELASYEQVKYS